MKRRSIFKLLGGLFVAPVAAKLGLKVLSDDAVGIPPTIISKAQADELSSLIYEISPAETPFMGAVSAYPQNIDEAMADWIYDMAPMDEPKVLPDDT